MKIQKLCSKFGLVEPLERMIYGTTLEILFIVYFASLPGAALTSYQY